MLAQIASHMSGSIQAHMFDVAVDVAEQLPMKMERLERMLW